MDPRHEVDVSWIPAIDVRFHVGVDGISLPLVVLTALLTLLCTVSTRPQGAGPRPRGRFSALVLLLKVGLLGTFVALDLVLFFVAFEVVLAPMYFLIAIWGGGARARHAATKFVLYTLLGSVFVIVGILTVYAATGTFDLVELSERGGAGIASGTQVLAFAALFAGFAVKSPLWPVHTWLPDAHTEAPTVGSVLLAGALLKMGTYGLVRVALPVLPEGAHTLAPLLGTLAVAGIVVGALCCLVQTDVKRLIAYSSVGHMGFVLLGIATLTPTGVNAALLGNIAHGLVTGLLFFLVGGLKDRYGTADLRVLGSGLSERLPRLGALFVLASVASLGPARAGRLLGGGVRAAGRVPPGARAVPASCTRCCSRWRPPAPPSRRRTSSACCAPSWWARTCRPATGGSVARWTCGRWSWPRGRRWPCSPWWWGSTRGWCSG